MENSNDIIVTVDIGSSKISAIAAKVTGVDKPQLLGLSKTQSKGVVKGKIVKINEIAESVRSVISDLKKRTNCEISKVTAAVPNAFVSTVKTRSSIEFITQTTVTEDILERMFTQTYNNLSTDENLILHLFPLNYVIDENILMPSPIGCECEKISCDMVAVIYKTKAYNNLKQCFTNAGLEVSNFVFEPLATAVSTLDGSDLKRGVVLVNIGAGKTNIAIFKSGHLQFTSTIPLGGNNITDDIADCFNISTKQAEAIKIKFGASLLDTGCKDKILSIVTGQTSSPKRISLNELTKVIQSRLEEILEHVVMIVVSSGFENQINAGYVITGGTVLLPRIGDLVKKITEKEMRKAGPFLEIDGTAVNPSESLFYVTSFGIIECEKRFPNLFRVPKKEPEPIVEKEVGVPPIEEATPVEKPQEKPEPQEQKSIWTLFGLQVHKESNPKPKKEKKASVQKEKKGSTLNKIVTGLFDDEDIPL